MDGRVEPGHDGSGAQHGWTAAGTSTYFPGGSNGNFGVGGGTCESEFKYHDAVGDAQEASGYWAATRGDTTVVLA
jgi:hypothetical protein